MQADTLPSLLSCPGMKGGHLLLAWGRIQAPNLDVASWLRDRDLEINRGGSPYLSEGQTIFVLVSVLHLKIVKCFALGQSLRQGPHTLDVAGWEEAMRALQLALVPILVNFAPQDDDIPFVELEVTGFFPLIAVEGLGIGKLG